MRNIRTRIAAGVLCALLVMIMVSFVTVQRVCSRLLAKTDAVCAAVDSGNDPTDAISALEDAWAADRYRLHLFVQSEPLTDLNDAVNRLRPMYASDCDELTAELSAIRAELIWLRKQERSVF